MNTAIRSYLLSILLLAAPAAQAVSLGTVYDTACESVAVLGAAYMLTCTLTESANLFDYRFEKIFSSVVIIYASRQLHKKFSGTEKTPSDNHHFLHRT